MSKHNKRIIQWHFWIPKYQYQIVVEDTNYQRAKVRVRESLEYYNRPAPTIEFQFGQSIS